MEPFEGLSEAQIAIAHTSAEMPLAPISRDIACFRCQKRIPANWKPENDDLLGCPYGVPWCDPSS